LILAIKFLNEQLIHYYKNKTPSLNYLVNFEFQIQNIISDTLGFTGYLKIHTKMHSMLML